MKKNIYKPLFYICLAVCLICIALPAHAKVSAQEAERLKKDLTPFGAIRAGNAEGTIPEWTGGMTEIPEGITWGGIKSGEVRPDPFVDEKPLYVITAQNLAEYKNIVSTGIQEMFFKKYPDTFQMHVYPTHRTMCAPQGVYDRTFENATRAVIEGKSMKGAFGGPGFPIPDWDKPDLCGMQLMYNHQSMWKGADMGFTTTAYVSYEDRLVRGNTTSYNVGFPFLWYEKDLAWYQAQESYYASLYSVILDPPASKGQLTVIHRTLDYEQSQDRSWSYSPGTRRVRRNPGISHDTPGGTGIFTMDDMYNWNGDPERFNWKYIETKEMLIPYNCYQWDLVEPAEEIFTPLHVNPKYIRWELHRTHVYEATLKEGSRHIYGRRIFYQDEDSWCNVMQDKFDTRGNFWRVQYVPTKLAYGDPPFMYARTFVVFDNQVSHYETVWTVQGNKNPMKYERWEPNVFTPQYLRRTGRR